LAVARVEPSGTMRWRCGVCGGPVVPKPADVAASQAELASLVAAQRARAIAVGWMAAACLLASIAVMALALGALVWGAAHVAGGVLAALGVAAATLTAATARRWRQSGASARASLDDAWERAALGVLRAKSGELTAEALASAMSTNVAHAESLLSRLAAEDRARVSVRDDADLGYRVAAGDEPDAPKTDAAKGRAP